MAGVRRGGITWASSGVKYNADCSAVHDIVLMNATVVVNNAKRLYMLMLFV